VFRRIRRRQLKAIRNRQSIPEEFTRPRLIQSRQCEATQRQAATLDEALITIYVADDGPQAYEMVSWASPRAARVPVRDSFAMRRRFTALRIICSALGEPSERIVTISNARIFQAPAAGVVGLSHISFFRS
jgi:hypothetical protein